MQVSEGSREPWNPSQQFPGWHLTMKSNWMKALAIMDKDF